MRFVFPAASEIPVHIMRLGTRKVRSSGIVPSQNIQRQCMSSGRTPANESFAQCHTPSHQNSHEIRGTFKGLSICSLFRVHHLNACTRRGVRLDATTLHQLWSTSTCLSPASEKGEHVAISGRWTDRFPSRVTLFPSQLLLPNNTGHALRKFAVFGDDVSAKRAMDEGCSRPLSTNAGTRALDSGADRRSVRTKFV